jgi:LysM repeat protein
LTADQVRVLIPGTEEFQTWDEQQENHSHSHRRTYTVRRGDTINEIAHRFGVRARDIIRWNDIDDPTSIRTGQVLRVR